MLQLLFGHAASTPFLGLSPAPPLPGGLPAGSADPSCNWLGIWLVPEEPGNPMASPAGKESHHLGREKKRCMESAGQLTKETAAVSLARVEPSPDVTEADLEPSGLKTLEHVAVTVSITHPRRGNLEIHLLCPSGMDSLVGTARSMDSDPTGFVDWTFSTVRCWGEEAQGTYRLTIRDVGDEMLRAGRLDQWQLTLYGSSWTPTQIQERQRLLEKAMSGQFLNGNFALPCPPGLRIPEQQPYTITANTLKTLMLLGCFAVFWTFYYMLEVFLSCDNGAFDFPARSRRASGGALMEDTVPLCKEAEAGAQQASPGLRELEEGWGSQGPHWGEEC